MENKVFSADIDISAPLESLAKGTALAGQAANNSIKHISNALNSLVSSMQEAGKAVERFTSSLDFNDLEGLGAPLNNAIIMSEGVVKGFDNIGTALTKIPLFKVGKEFSFLENMGARCFNGLILGVKAFGLALRLSLAPLRMMFFVLELIMSLNPFGALAQVLEKLNELAKGSTKHNEVSKDMKVDPKKLRAFMQASEVHQLGFEENELASVYQNLRSPDKAHSFATLGVDREQAKKLDGADLSMLLLKKLEENIKNAGGWDSDAAQVYKDAYADAGGDIASAQSRFRNAKAFQQDFKKFQSRDAGGDEAMQSFEKSFKRLSVAFENLYRKVMVPLYPIFENLVVLLENGVVWLGEFFDKIISFVKNFSLPEGIKEQFDKASKFAGEIGSSVKNIAKTQFDAISKSFGFGDKKDERPKKEIIVEGLQNGYDEVKKLADKAKKAYGADVEKISDYIKEAVGLEDKKPEAPKVDVNINLQTKGDKIMVETRSSTGQQLAAESIRVGAR